MRPDYTRETALIEAGNAHVCGVDEAGRGPLAGPVVSAAVHIRPGCVPPDLDDSKALSHAARERLLNVLKKAEKNGEVLIGVGIAEPHEIERRNILWASMAAMERAVDALPGQFYALIDGNRVPPGLSGRAEAIVGGDARCVSIAAASIVAKVMRDQLMGEAEARFSGYGLGGHKGYPTAAHRQILAEIGPCPIHRVGFNGVGTLL